MYANHAYGSCMVCVQNECIDDATCKHAQHAHYACLRIISSGFFILAKFVFWQRQFLLFAARQILISVMRNLAQARFACGPNSKFGTGIICLFSAVSFVEGILHSCFLHNRHFQQITIIVFWQGHIFRLPTNRILIFEIQFSRIRLFLFKLAELPNF